MAGYPCNDIPRPQSSHGHPNVYPPQTGPCQDCQAGQLQHCYSSPAQMEGSGMSHHQRSGSCSCCQHQYSHNSVPCNHPHSDGHHGHPLHSASVPPYGHRHPVDHVTAPVCCSTSQNGKSKPDYLKCLPLGKLHVTVGEARGIKGDEFFNWGKGDPFCTLQLGAEKDGANRKTSVRKDAGSNALWNEVLAFTIKEEHEDYNSFSVSLWNKNKTRGNSFLGDVRISHLGGLVATHKNNVPEYWYPIYLEGKQKGDISLVFDFIPMHAHNILKTSSLITESAPEGKYVNATRRVKLDWVQAIAGVTQVAVGSAALAI